MDKRDALRLCISYISKVKKTKIKFEEVWLFGSYSKGNYHNDSDIDIAFVLADNELHTFETDVKLMTIREGEETIIEPHAFSKEEFIESFPIVYQIIKYGERINY